MIPLTLLFVKLTLFILYADMFQPMRWLRNWIWAGAIIMVLVYTGSSIAQLIFLTPKRNENWLEHYTGPAPYNAEVLSLPLSVFGAVIDLYIILLPSLGVSHLQLSFRRKIGVMLMFMTGIL